MRSNKGHANLAQHVLPKVWMALIVLCLHTTSSNQENLQHDFSLIDLEQSDTESQNSIAFSSDDSKPLDFESENSARVSSDQPQQQASDAAAGDVDAPHDPNESCATLTLEAPEDGDCLARCPHIHSTLSNTHRSDNRARRERGWQSRTATHCAQPRESRLSSPPRPPNRPLRSSPNHAKGVARCCERSARPCCGGLARLARHGESAPDTQHCKPCSAARRIHPAPAPAQKVRARTFNGQRPLKRWQFFGKLRGGGSGGRSSFPLPLRRRSGRRP